jgi:hypothetical protein
MATWLEQQVNAYRALGNLPAVTEDPTLSANASDCAKYLVETVGQLIHQLDDPASDTLKKTAQNSNLWGNSDPNAPDSQAIQEWCSSVFHFIQIISAGLQPVGFGSFRTSGPTASPSYKVAAAITVPSLYQNNAPPNYPFMWPANGQTISQTTYQPETPDARTFCNYTGDAGQPIFLLTGNVTSPVTASLVRDGVTVPVCEIDQYNYTNPDPIWQQAGQGLLGSDGMVVLLPQNPLKNGNYTATITVGASPNQRTYTWSFVVGPPTIMYNKLYYIQNGYNTWSGGYLDVSGVVPGGYLDWVNPRDPGGNLLSVSTDSLNTRDRLSGTWKILSTTGQTGPVQYHDIIYLQNQYDLQAWIQGGSWPVGQPPDPGVLGGYLDVRGAVGAWDPGPGNLFRVSTAASNQRPNRSGTWRITSITDKSGPVLANEGIYLRNQYDGQGRDPNELGGYLEVRGAVAASDPGGGLLRVLTVTPDQFDQGSGTWRFAPCPITP